MHTNGLLVSALCREHILSMSSSLTVRCREAILRKPPPEASIPKRKPFLKRPGSPVQVSMIIEYNFEITPNRLRIPSSHHVQFTVCLSGPVDFSRPERSNFFFLGNVGRENMLRRRSMHSSRHAKSLPLRLEGVLRRSSYSAGGGDHRC